MRLISINYLYKSFLLEWILLGASLGCRWRLQNQPSLLVQADRSWSACCRSVTETCCPPGQCVLVQQISPKLLSRNSVCSLWLPGRPTLSGVRWRFKPIHVCGILQEPNGSAAEHRWDLKPGWRPPTVTCILIQLESQRVDVIAFRKRKWMNRKPILKCEIKYGPLLCGAVNILLCSGKSLVVLL